MKTSVSESSPIHQHGGCVPATNAKTIGTHLAAALAGALGTMGVQQMVVGSGNEVAGRDIIKVATPPPSQAVLERLRSDAVNAQSVALQLRADNKFPKDWRAAAELLALGNAALERGEKETAKQVFERATSDFERLHASARAQENEPFNLEAQKLSTDSLRMVAKNNLGTPESKRLFAEAESALKLAAAAEKSGNMDTAFEQLREAGRKYSEAYRLGR